MYYELQIASDGLLYVIIEIDCLDKTLVVCNEVNGFTYENDIIDFI